MGTALLLTHGVVVADGRQDGKASDGHAEWAAKGGQMKILVYGAGNIGSLYAGLLKESGQDVSTPATDRLYQYLDANAEPIPAGSSEIPVNWNALWIALGVFAALAASLSLLLC